MRCADWVWSRVSGSPVLVLLLAGLAAPDGTGRSVPTLQPRPPRCAPVSEHDLVSVDAEIDTGQYTLTLVATAGPSAGASAQGGLWLVLPRGARDSGGAPSASHAARARPELPLYGATAVDLAGVSAPIAADSSAVPSPHSFDPQRPGVLVRYRVDASTAGGVWRLYIATNRNDQRACHLGTTCWDHASREGPGVVLDVHKIDTSGFAGLGSPWPRADAHGYFCAAPCALLLAVQDTHRAAFRRSPTKQTPRDSRARPPGARTRTWSAARARIRRRYGRRAARRSLWRWPGPTPSLLACGHRSRRAAETV